MAPATNPKVLAALESAHAIIYSIGSLYTSLAPSLILRGVGAALSRPGGPRFKILLLNGSLDRETAGFSATDFVAAVARACEESCGRDGEPAFTVYNQYVTHIIHLEGDGAPPVDRAALGRWGVECIRVYGRRVGDGEGEKGMLTYDGNALAQALSWILGKRDPREGRSRRNTSDG